MFLITRLNKNEYFDIVKNIGVIIKATSNLQVKNTFIKFDNKDAIVKKTNKEILNLLNLTNFDVFNIRYF